MKSVIDNITRDELKERINSLTPEHAALWGKMNVYQMLEHCTRCDDMYHGALHIKRVFIGRLLGKMFKNKILKKDLLFGKSSPTAALLTITETQGDMDEQKRAWQQRIDNIAASTTPALYILSLER